MNSMRTTDVLVDTNVLCYSTDQRDLEKHDRAREVLRQLRRDDRAVLSPQITGEFARSSTRPHRGWLTASEAAGVLREMLPAVRVVSWTRDVPVLAVAGMLRHCWSYWDSQIGATAIAGGYRLVL